MKKLILPLIFACNMAWALDGDELKIVVPLDLTEGTEVDLSVEKLKPFASWLEDTRAQLSLAKEGSEQLSRSERYQKYRRAIEKILSKGDQSKNEMLTRYVLKRALVIDNTLNDEDESYGIIDLRLQLLTESIELAMAKYESDLKILNSDASTVVDINFIGFGTEYATMLETLARTILDSSAQYKVYRNLLGFLQWDMFRDSNKKTVMLEIYRINELLERVGETVPAESFVVLKQIREMKHVFKLSFDNRKEEARVLVAAQQAEEVKKSPPSESVQTILAAQKLGNCKIFPPDIYDEDRASYCSGSWGIEYKGRKVLCVADPDKAVHFMIENSSSCQQSGTEGNYTILKPDFYDPNRASYCSGSWGIVYAGNKVNCGYTFIEALAQANKLNSVN